MENKLFLLDAYALIYRAYYAFIKSPRINSKGINTAAIFGFVNTLDDLLKKEKPSHIGVVFDPSGKTFRHKIYTPYKAQRESTPEDIRLSVPIIKTIIDSYNIPVITVDGYEADDVIGTLAIKAEQKDFIVYMVTPDKDYAQLVSDKVFMFKPPRGGGRYERIGVPEVLTRYDIKYTSQVIDLLGLMGDASDNIPGCPGVGEKTAIKLIQEFSSIENLLNNTEYVKGKLREKLEGAKDQIILSKMLATIVQDVPVDLDLDLLSISDPNVNKLCNIFEELEFRNKLKELSSLQVRNHEDSTLFTLFDFNEEDGIRKVAKNNKEQKYESCRRTIDDTPHEYQLVLSEDQKDALILNLKQSSSFCIDTETSGLTPLECELVGISFCMENHKAFYVPISKDKEEAIEQVNIFKDVLENAAIEKIGQNIKFDCLVLSNYGVRVKGKFFDTMIAHYLINPEMRHSLNVLSETYLNYTPIPIESLIGPKGKSQKSMLELDAKEVSDYACEDADLCFQLKSILEKELKKENLFKLFNEVEMPLVAVLVDMEKQGVLIDTLALDEYALKLNLTIENLKDSILEQSGVVFNLDSPKQVGDILFGEMKLDPKAKKTKSGQYATTEDILQKLKGKHPIVDNLLLYRGLQKLLTTYVFALPNLKNPITQRIHTSYNQGIVATGRLSSTNPNLQNIPIRTASGREIRRCFIPKEGCLFLSADYSQVELRIMAHLSKDKNMLSAFNSNEDIHTSTAAKIYHLEPSDVTEDMRRKAKTANFGIIYGISVFGLSERLSIPRAEAKLLIDGYFEVYPQVKEYMDHSIKVAQELGYVETILNRKRHLPDINSQNRVVRGVAERNSINAPIQGSAADIIKLSMVRIYDSLMKNNLKSKMILQVHDELNFEVYEDELEQVKSIVRYEMEHAYPLLIPLNVDMGVGLSWLEAH